LAIGIVTGQADRQAFVAANQAKISRLVGAAELHWGPDARAGQLLGIVDSDGQVGVTVPQQSLEALRLRLEKDLAKAEKEVAGLAGRLANPNFAGKAPPEVVAECQANLAEAEAQALLVRGRLADLVGANS
jgi:valyl-tRNA synthetase